MENRGYYLFGTCVRGRALYLNSADDTADGHRFIVARYREARAYGQYDRLFVLFMGDSLTTRQLSEDEL